MTSPLPQIPSPVAARPSRRTVAFGAALAGLFTLTACDGANLDVSWDSDSVDGSGNVTTQTYEVDDFDEITVCCDLDVMLEIEDGGEKSVEITIDDNLHGYLDIEVTGGDLEIKPDPDTHLDPTGDVIVRISGYTIDGLGVGTASDVRGDFPATAAFHVRADTAADVTISVDTVKLTVNADTAADVNIVGQAETIDVTADTSADVVLTAVRGVVDVNVNADTSADVEIDASGTVTGTASTGADVEVWGGPTISIDTDTGAEVQRKN